MLSLCIKFRVRSSGGWQRRRHSCIHSEAGLEVATCNRCLGWPNHWKTRRVYDLHAASVATCLVRSLCAAGQSRDLSGLPPGVPREVEGISSRDYPPLLLSSCYCFNNIQVCLEVDLQRSDKDNYNKQRALCNTLLFFSEVPCFYKTEARPRFQQKNLTYSSRIKKMLASSYFCWNPEN